MKLLLTIMLIILTISCSSNMKYYRKVKIIDELGVPISGVRRSPGQKFGKFGRPSSKKGMIYAPKNGGFYLLRRGYETTVVISGDNSDFYILKKLESKPEVRETN